jgi:hypothetical protein
MVELFSPRSIELYEPFYEPTPQGVAEPSPAGPKKRPWAIKPDLREPNGTERPSRNNCDYGSEGWGFEFLRAR